MSDNFAKDFLTADTHGIPNFVWLGIIVVGVGVGIYFKNRTSNQVAAAIDPNQQTASGTGPVFTGSDQPPVTVPSDPTQQMQPIFYTVVSGDTLSKIAVSHGLTLNQLLAFPENSGYLSHENLIYPGDKVRVA